LSVQSEPALRVLAGALSCGVDLIDDLSRLVTDDHFSDPTLRTLWRAVLTYRSVASGVLTRRVIENMTSKVAPGTAALIREQFDALQRQPETPDTARWAAHELREERERWLTSRMFSDAQEIMSGEVTEEPDALGRPGRTWAGPADAREWAERRLAEIATETAVSESPADDVLREGRTILDDFVRARTSDRSRVPLTGIPSFDEMTLGLGKGLIMVAAPSGFGKTQLCVSLAYHAAQMQGLNVYFATSETVRELVRARLVARHSRHPKFADHCADLNLPLGLDSKLIDRGMLPEEHIPLLRDVAIDWGANGQRTDTEGTCYVAQMPFGQTVSALRAMVDIRARAAKPDLVIVDYIALMASTGRHSSTREELSTLVKESAHMAVDFDKGSGVPLVSPWQMNRKSQEEFVRTGELDPNGLAETAEAVNSAHLVVALSPDGARNGRKAGVKVNVLKCRDGVTLTGEQGIPVEVDYATSYFEQRVSAGAGSSFEPGSDESMDLLGSFAGS
jgi:hypothetical protein